MHLLNGPSLQLLPDATGELKDTMKSSASSKAWPSLSPHGPDPMALA